MLGDDFQEMLRSMIQRLVQEAVKQAMLGMFPSTAGATAASHLGSSNVAGPSTAAGAGNQNDGWQVKGAAKAKGGKDKAKLKGV